MTQDTTDGVRCLVSDPDLGDGEHWVMSQDTDITKHLPPLGVHEYDEDGPGAREPSKNLGPFKPLSPHYVERDTEQGTRLDYDRRIPELPGFVFEASPFNPGAGRIEFEHGQTDHVPTTAERIAVQVAAESRLIARALRVATDAELAEAGLVRRQVLADEYEKARSRVRAKSNAAALGVSSTLASRWAALHQRVMQAVELHIEARAEVIRWRNQAAAGAPNPKMVAAQDVGNALLRVIEEMAEERVDRESGGAA